ncbi:MAG TPA: ATP synthase F0 subunit B [Pyrinomonadaceae bacterium]|nr:ATP synthase F0 subunit B [Pyrinomonadaceae bacterium]
MEWFNYPGLELWKFVNLAIFTAAGIYVLRRPISQALSARRGAIEQELVAAQAERERALARVAEADARLSRLDDDVRALHEQARKEAESERQRLAASTDRELEKLKQQATREMETADKVARKELRQYLAKRSVELARESVRSQMRPEDDTLLIKESIGELRRTTA